MYDSFFFSSRRRHTRCALVTGVQTCALPLTRRSLVTILTESGRLSDFKRNPQAFIELAAEVINRTKRLALVDGIKYQRVGVDTFYAQELFEQEELTGYLKKLGSAPCREREWQYV